MAANYAVYVLDVSGNRITQIKNFVHTHLSGNTYHKGNIIQLTRVLSSYATLDIRVAREDPMFAKFGNIVDPWKYGLEVTHGGTTIFKGVIADNSPYRRQYWVDVHAYGYLFRLDRKLVNRDPAQTPDNGSENYRTFDGSNGITTMAQAITTMISEAKAACPANDIIQRITIGNIVNPNFPAGFMKADGVTPLTGPWTFSSDMTLQFDYKSILYVIQSFAVYAVCDFELTDDLVLNFTPTFGVDRSQQLTFEFGPRGQIFDYNVPLQGERQLNSLWGIASDNDGNILHIQQTDQNSINDNDILLEGVMGFTDVKDSNSLQSRVVQELNLISEPSSVINVYMNRKAYPFSMYDVGDIVTIKIDDGMVQVNEPRRITAIGLDVRDTGTEFITLQTNPPLLGQV